MKDLLLSGDFFPMIGGAHHWLYNLYSRWSNPVTVFAGSQPIGSVDSNEQQNIFDSRNHGSLLIRRIDLSIDDISIFNYAFWKTLLTAVRLISAETGNSQATLHCLRAFPEGILGLAWKALAPRRRRIVTFAHGEEITVARSSRQLQAFSCLVYGISDLVVANSLNTETLVHSLVPSAKTTVVHPGVAPADFVFPKEELERCRTFYGFERDDVVLVTVARMEARKNHANVLKALRYLLDFGLRLKYLIVGGGEEEQNLRNMSGNLCLEHAVRFAGVLPDQERSLAMALADIHIMPSINYSVVFEGFGIVFLEAAAAGIPSIAGNTGGQTEAVIDGRTGFIVDGTNLDAIIGAVRQLAENRQLRYDMGTFGRQWAAAHEWHTLVAKTNQAIYGSGCEKYSSNGCEQK